MVDVAYGMEWWHVRSATQIFGLEVLGSVAEIRAHLVVHHPVCLQGDFDQPVPDRAYRVWGLGARAESLAKHFKVTVLGWWGMTEALAQGIISAVISLVRTAAWGEWHPNTTLKFVTRRDGWHGLASAVYFTSAAFAG